MSVSGKKLTKAQLNKLHEFEAYATEWARLKDRYKFKVGQRVRPSDEGIRHNIFKGTYRGVDKSKASGVVIAVDQFNSPTVRWSYRKTGVRYYGGFIVPDRRPIMSGRSALTSGGKS